MKRIFATALAIAILAGIFPTTSLAHAQEQPAVQLPVDDQYEEGLSGQCSYMDGETFVTIEMSQFGEYLSLPAYERTLTRGDVTCVFVNNTGEYAYFNHPPLHVVKMVGPGEVYTHVYQAGKFYQWLTFSRYMCSGCTLPDETTELQANCQLQNGRFQRYFVADDNGDLVLERNDALDYATINSAFEIGCDLRNGTNAPAYFYVRDGQAIRIEAQSFTFTVFMRDQFYVNARFSHTPPTA